MGEHEGSDNAFVGLAFLQRIGNIPLPDFDIPDVASFQLSSQLVEHGLDWVQCHHLVRNPRSRKGAQPRTTPDIKDMVRRLDNAVYHMHQVSLVCRIKPNR